MLKIVDRSGVCSTLSFTGISICDDKFTRDYYGGVEAYIVKTLKYQIIVAESQTEMYWCYNPASNNRAERKVLDGHPVSSFALFYTTIETIKAYEPARRVLKKLGFKIDEEVQIWNKKNNTKIYPVYGVVKNVLENLEKYDAHGKLIVQPDLDVEVVEDKKASKKKSPDEVRAAA